MRTSPLLPRANYKGNLLILGIIGSELIQSNKFLWVADPGIINELHAGTLHTKPLFEAETNSIRGYVGESSLWDVGEMRRKRKGGRGRIAQF